MAFRKVSKILRGNIDIVVSFADSLSDFSTEFPLEKVTVINIPIINVSLYRYIPYLLKKYLVMNRTETQSSFSWSSKFPTQWAYTTSTAKISSKKTEKPVFIYFENQGIHTLHSSPTYPSGGNPKSISDMEDILYHQLTYNTRMLNDIISILKKQNIYDSTKIILAADHGITTSAKDLVLPYFQQISTSGVKAFYENNTNVGTLLHIPVMVMTKNFNTTQETMQIDSRFLSLGDLHGSIINTFTNISTIPDYTKIIPPKRVFNMPGVGGLAIQILAKIITNQKFVEYSNNRIPIIRVKSVKDGVFEIDSYDFDKIGDLPAFEILE